MRFLADACVFAPTVARLRAWHHDVRLAQARHDEEVLREAVSGHRCLLTFDLDFGRLAAGMHDGILIVRAKPLTPETVAEILGDNLTRIPPGGTANKLIMMTAAGLRIRETVGE